MPLRVHVTAEDIANGTAGKCQKCPIALAVQRTLGVNYRSYVMQDFIHIAPADHSIHLILENKAVRISHTPEIRAFISRFDTELNSRFTCEPFKFELDFEPISGTL